MFRSGQAGVSTKVFPISVQRNITSMVSCAHDTVDRLRLILSTPRSILALPPTAERSKHYYFNQPSFSILKVHNVFPA